MVGNNTKLLGILQNGWEWYKMVRNNTKCLGIIQNGWE